MRKDTFSLKDLKNMYMIILFQILTITPFNINIDAHFDPAERLSLGHRHLHVFSGIFDTTHTKILQIYPQKFTKN